MFSQVKIGLMDSVLSESLSPLKLARRERLLDAAERVFQADGFRGASMARIAAAASMSKVTLYGYFPDKEAAFVAVAERFARRLGAAFTMALGGHGSLAARVANALISKQQAVSELVRQSAEASDLFWAQARLAGAIFTQLDQAMIGQIAAALQADGIADAERLAALAFAAAHGIASAGTRDLSGDIRLLTARLLGRATDE